MNGYDLPIQGYQGKAPYISRPSYHGKHLTMKIKANEGRVLLINPSYHKMMLCMSSINSSYHAWSCLTKSCY
ncbi:hypothetical protein H5410_051082 [Solanum commersonii]|uniref:Uncharacterized protein n=1 Tax=Solanum commersonii TaxID=4109 RepID=A0A9J5WYK3_SOLCO|nr:hypothetical protein H5410_051082 [Solanum commersonii]